MSAARRKRVRAAAILGGAFRVWLTTLPQLLLIAALPMAPLIALQLFSAGRPPPDSVRGVIARALPIFDLVVSGAAKACAVTLVLRRLRGEPGAPLASLRDGARRLGTALGITAIVNAPNGVFAALNVLFATEVLPDPTLPVSSWGRFAWYVPAAVFVFLVDVFLCVPIPIAVVERRGVIASIGRSWFLTRGNRLPIAAAYLVMSLVAAMVFSVLLRGSLSGDSELLFDVAFDLAAASITCVVPVVAYHELREAEEGSVGEKLVKVFE